MAQIFTDNTLSIGNTPLVKLNRILGNAGATVLAKIEGRNPAYSVKCRIGVDDQDPEVALRDLVSRVKTAGTDAVTAASASTRP